MTAPLLQEIDERLRQLPPEKLATVYDFVSYLIERETVVMLAQPVLDSHTLALANEAMQGREWDTPKEDAAWSAFFATLDAIAASPVLPNARSATAEATENRR